MEIENWKVGQCFQDHVKGFEFQIGLGFNLFKVYPVYKKGNSMVMV